MERRDTLRHTFVRKVAPGSNHIYDTLDNAPDSALSDVRILHSLLVEPVRNGVGILISGQADLPYEGDGDQYWGRSFRLETGENLQIRVYPRNCMGKPLIKNVPRMMAFRRTSPTLVPVVGVVILYLPSELGNGAGSINMPLSSARTIGCRAVQIILPSLFSKHDAKRELPNQLTSTDSYGYHSVRPSTYTITKVTRYKEKLGGGEFTMSVSPGHSYLVLASHMCGIDMADPLSRTTIPISGKDHLSRSAALQRQLVSGVGDASAEDHISAAFTLLDLIGVEGVVSMPCNSFFFGALPDMFHSPLGLPLVVVMASRIACFSGDFNLPSCTPNDAHANREIAAAFNERWMPVTKTECRAIDCAIKAGYDWAVERVLRDGKTPEEEKTLRVCLDDNMAFWQRVGQRINTRLVSEVRDSHRRGSKTPYDTTFGVAELFQDAISDSKYAHWERNGVGAPISEAAINRIYLASRADMRTQFNSMQDRVEIWLRDGLYGQQRLSKENVNVAQVAKRVQRFKASVGNDDIDSEGDSDSSSSSGEISTECEDDGDQVLDFKLNVAAMESAAGAVSVSMIEAASIFHQFGMKAFLVGEGCRQKCADCENIIGVVEGIMLESVASQCVFCNHRRCFSCASSALRRMDSMSHCGACRGESKESSSENKKKAAKSPARGSHKK